MPISKIKLPGDCIDMYEDCLTKKESNVYGLKYIPSIEPKLSDRSDYIELSKQVGRDDGNGQFTFRDAEIMKESFEKIKNDAKCIVEIGVASNFGNSSTELWLVSKMDDTHYFGIDIDMERKMHHEDFKPNTHMLSLNSSADRETICKKMAEYGCEKIDVLFIDGDHSIDLTVNDW